MKTLYFEHKEISQDQQNNKELLQKSEDQIAAQIELVRPGIRIVQRIRMRLHDRREQKAHNPDRQDRIKGGYG